MPGALWHPYLRLCYPGASLQPAPVQPHPVPAPVSVPAVDCDDLDLYALRAVEIPACLFFLPGFVFLQGLALDTVQLFSKTFLLLLFFFNLKMKK